MGKWSHVPQAAPAPQLSANAVLLLSPSLWLAVQRSPTAKREEGRAVPSWFLFWTAKLPRSWSIRTFTCVGTSVLCTAVKYTLHRKACTERFHMFKPKRVFCHVCSVSRGAAALKGLAQPLTCVHQRELVSTAVLRRTWALMSQLR